VGTGGGGSLVGYSPIDNSEVINNETYGVIKLTLHSDSYNWEFIPIEGFTFTDSGSYLCSVPPVLPTSTFTPIPSQTATITPTPTTTPLHIKTYLPMVTKD
jgi:hypothetical protein